MRRLLTAGSPLPYLHGTRTFTVRPSTTTRSRLVSWIGERRLPLVALLLGVPMIVIAAMASVVWLGRPFPGFFVLSNLMVPQVTSYDWTGMRAGVPLHARLLTVDDEPVTSAAQVYARAAQVPVGTPIRYLVEKGGRRSQHSVRTMRFGAGAYWPTLGLLLLNGLLYLGAGIVVSLVQPRTAAARAFLSMGFVTGFYALTAPPLFYPPLAWLAPLHCAAQAFLPATFIHLALCFPVSRPFVARRPVWLIVPYAGSALLTLWMIVEFYASPPWLGPFYVAFVYAAASITTFIALLVVAYRENRNSAVGLRIRALLPGWIVGTAVALPGFLMSATTGGDFPITWIAVTPLAFYAAIGYAIVWHDLFGIDVLVKRTVVYVSLTAVITAMYALCLVVLGWLMPPYIAATSSPLFNIAFVVLVAIAFEPLRLRAQDIVDRTFFRSQVDYRRTVRDVSAALTWVLDFDEILGRVGRTLRDGIAPRSFAVVLWIDGRPRLWRLANDSGAVAAAASPPLEALRRLLTDSPRRPWVVDGFDGARGEPDARSEAEALEAAVVLPLTRGETLLGVFLLGPRRSGRPYSREDLELLDTLAAQSAIAIHNTLLYGELHRLVAELETKVEERTAELRASHTELEHAYRDLQNAQAQLVQSEKLASLGQLVAGVAHEINNPVAFIAGNVTPLRKTLASLQEVASRHEIVELSRIARRATSILEIMAEGAVRTAAIVNDLRAFSRVGEETPRPVDLHDALEVNLRLLASRWTTRVELHRDYGAVPLVEVAPGQLNQVLMNVLANAFDAITDAGHVWIRTRCDGRSVSIAIRDDGSGIAAEHLGRVFDPFFTTKPLGQGTGLGLSISHGIVNRHGGDIRVRSTAGVGSEFEVELPVRACATPDAAGAAMPA